MSPPNPIRPLNERPAPAAASPNTAQTDPQPFYAHPLSGAPTTHEILTGGLNLNVLRAHTDNRRGDRDSFIRHAKRVAALAGQFAAECSKLPMIKPLARLLGLWHDLGKVNPKFQHYLDDEEAGRPSTKVVHAIWGAALAYWWLWKTQGQNEWKAVALPILGHHAGLEDVGTAGTKLEEFLRSASTENPILQMRMLLPQLGKVPDLPKWMAGDPEPRKVIRWELMIRFCFSALVDADYIVTERHFDPARSRQRKVGLTMTDLWSVFCDDQRELSRQNRTKPVNRVRREVYAASLRRAALAPGIFRLTVPTGGGKTRSSLGFALRHAIRHSLRRVIFALPYTSIIDQTVREYRSIFEPLERDGRVVVLEHHSQVDVPDNERQDETHLRQRLASENWDAPLVVTTTLQLFESLLGNKPSRTRKLHNIARSVIVLDEVQTLPTEVLQPTLDVLRTLVDDYGVTLVLCTATQPALDDSAYLDAFQGVRITEIVTKADYNRHFNELRRVAYERRDEHLSWRELANELRDQPQAMVVLNTRRDALALFNEIEALEGRFHLSTMLCGAHRKDVLDVVRSRIDPKHPQYEPGPIRLISTQVVEAGVDLDFPVVFRALAPLDRIIQAAGRCDREGNLTEKLGKPGGRVVIFQPADGAVPLGPYKLGTIETEKLLNRYGADRLHDPSLCHKYFQTLYADLDRQLDKYGIQNLRADMMYREVAAKYRLIPDDTVPVVIPKYHDGEGQRRLDKWLNNPSLASWRRVQPYVVNVYRWELQRRLADWVEPVTEHLYCWKGDYDARGIVPGRYDPCDLILAES